MLFFTEMKVTLKFLSDLSPGLMFIRKEIVTFLGGFFIFHSSDSFPCGVKYTFRVFCGQNIKNYSVSLLFVNNTIVHI